MPEQVSLTHSAGWDSYTRAMSNAVHGPLPPVHYSMTDLSWEILKEWRINSGHQEILCLTYRFIVHVVPRPCTRSTAYSSSRWGVFCFCNAVVFITLFHWSEIPLTHICADCPSNAINKVIVSLLHEETRPYIWDSFLHVSELNRDVGRYLTNFKEPNESLELLSPLFFSLAFPLPHLIPSVLEGFASDISRSFVIINSRLNSTTCTGEFSLSNIYTVCSSKILWRVFSPWLCKLLTL